jgi:hypothetical protein
MRAINKLKKEDHAVISKILDVVESKTTGIYEGIFENFKSYDLQMSKLSDLLIGRVSKSMIETPLINERFNGSKIYSSEKDKGISFGMVLVDYRGGSPLMAFVVERDSDGFIYKSCRKISGEWINSSNQEFSGSSFDELSSNLVELLDNDVKWFTDKYKLN